MDEQTWPAVHEALLTLGRPVGYEPADWGRSVVAGMTREHVPNLIGMLDDPSLNDETAEEPQFYAPIHAWRALGHFKAVEAVEALIRCLEVRQRWKDFDEWSIEEVPKVLRAFGPEAIAGMVKPIADPATEGHSASVVAEALAKIAVAHPEHREQIVSRLMEVGERFDERAKEANDGLVMALMDLKALEAVPLLRRIFHAKAVNADMVGDWGDVRRELELEREEGDPPERHRGESVHGRTRRSVSWRGVSSSRKSGRRWTHLRRRRIRPPPPRRNTPPNGIASRRRSASSRPVVAERDYLSRARACDTMSTPRQLAVDVDEVAEAMRRSGWPTKMTPSMS